MPEKQGVYRRVISKVFHDHHTKGATDVEFSRAELAAAAQDLGLDVSKNLGDIPYAFRYRQDLPKDVNDTAPKGKEWIIRSVGTSKYRFSAVPAIRIEPTLGRYRIKVPDATPEIVGKYVLNSEQALLAKLRYNRLIDIFAGVTAYSLQNHLKTRVKGLSQIEVDELYLGIGKTGAQYVLPVEAKGHGDKLGRVQFEQDIALCRERFPELICRPIATQFMAEGVIAMFELIITGDDLQIVDEKHYQLVAASDISEQDLETMRKMAAD